MCSICKCSVWGGWPEIFPKVRYLDRFPWSMRDNTNVSATSTTCRVSMWIWFVDRVFRPDTPGIAHRIQTHGDAGPIDQQFIAIPALHDRMFVYVADYVYRSRNCNHTCPYKLCSKELYNFSEQSSRPRIHYESKPWFLWILQFIPRADSCIS